MKNTSQKKIRKRFFVEKTILKQNYFSDRENIRIKKFLSG